MINYKLVQKAPVFSPYQVYLEWLALLEGLLDASLMTQACFGFTICIKQIVSISGKEMHDRSTVQYIGQESWLKPHSSRSSLATLGQTKLSFINYKTNNLAKQFLSPFLAPVLSYIRIKQTFRDLVMSGSVVHELSPITIAVVCANVNLHVPRWKT